MKEETNDWGDYKKLPEEIPEFPLIRRVLLGADSILQTPRLRAFETNEMRGVKFSKNRVSCAETLLCCNSSNLCTRMSRRGDE